MVQILSQKNILHYPQLDTVLMVEEFIRENSGEYKKTNLFKNLPRKVMWQTFQVIIEYLENSNKILIDKEGFVVWIWDPELIRKLQEKNLIWKG